MPRPSTAMLRDAAKKLRRYSAGHYQETVQGPDGPVLVIGVVVIDQKTGEQTAIPLITVCRDVALEMAQNIMKGAA